MGPGWYIAVHTVDIANIVDIVDTVDIVDIIVGIIDIVDIVDIVDIIWFKLSQNRDWHDTPSNMGVSDVSSF